MTTYLLAPDSFKESMTSRQVCEAMAFGIWMHLHSLRCAPSAADVPEAAGRNIMAFLRERKRQAQEERYLTSLRKTPVRQSYGVEPLPCVKSVASFATVTACA